MYIRGLDLHEIALYICGRNADPLISKNGLPRMLTPVHITAYGLGDSVALACHGKYAGTQTTTGSIIHYTLDNIHL